MLPPENAIPPQPPEKVNPAANNRVDDIQKLIATFKMERFFYVILTTLSALTLIGIGMYLALFKNDTQTFIVLLGPTGVLTLCIFRILKMWDDALKYISNTPPKSN